MSQIFLGILSGTSMDAVDVAAVDFDCHPFKLLGTHSQIYPADIQHSIRQLATPGHDEINQLGQLDREIGLLFANSCNALLQKLNLNKKDILAIGSHGQTIRHNPHSKHAYTLQIGDPNTIAEVTGITTIADFRRRDIACGGQGAPLTPTFHHFAFHSPEINRAVVNIGGIANITFLDKQSSFAPGYDCGPGNTLLDQWINKHLGLAMDKDGSWAKEGTPHQGLLATLLDDDYFKMLPPKSTGPEHFNLTWLEAKKADLILGPQDVQSTLSELTAHSIANAILDTHWDKGEIFICGGGVYNTDLLTRISNKLGERFNLHSTANINVDPRWVEAIAFAWLAKQTLNHRPGNLPEATGAKNKAVLGGVFYGSI